MRCLTQWRTSIDGVVGLDYGVMLQLASLLGVTVTEQVLDDVQVMEAHAIAKAKRRK